MQEHAWEQIISSAVVPVVIISACGLLCLALYNRLASIISRLRTLQRERLAGYKELFRLEEERKSGLIKVESEQYLHFLERQTAEVMKKAHYMRLSILSLLGAIASLLCSSLVIGISHFYVGFDIAVLVFFVLGLVLMLSGLCFAFLEVRISLNPIKMESAFLQKLIKDLSK